MVKVLSSFLGWMALGVLLPGVALCFVLVASIPRPPLTWMYLLTVGLLALLLVSRLFKSIAAVIANQKGVRQLAGDKYWVHWIYTPEEWQRFWQTSPDRHWYPGFIILLALALFLGPVLLGVLLGSSSLTTPGAFVVTAIIILALGLAPFQGHMLWRHRLKHTQREISITALGIYYGPNDFAALKNFDKITRDEEDATILQLICHISNTVPRAGTAIVPKITPVPIPRGYEQEAERLIERFQHKPARKKDMWPQSSRESMSTSSEEM